MASGTSTGRCSARAQMEFLEKQSCSSLANSARVKFLSAIQLTTLTPWILPASTKLLSDAVRHRLGS